MDTAAQWPPQDIVVKQMEEIVTCPKAASAAAASSSVEIRKVRPHKEEALNCPRCNSSNTKFCYYNNYSLSQPRYFCKTCRRYWTEGGSLRNIPVGGGSRKNKRSSSSSTSSTSSNSSSKKLPHLIPPHPNPTSKILQTQDLNLGFSIHHDFNDMIHVPNYENAPTKHNPSSSSSPPSHHHHLSSLELLTGLTASRGLSSFMPPLPVATSTDPTSVVYSSDFPSLPDFKPSLNFSLDGLGSNYATFQGVQETNGKLLFPFEDLKQVSANANEADHQHNRDHQHGAASTGYWNGVIGGGSW